VSAVAVGAALGAAAGSGLWLVGSRVVALRRRDLRSRVLVHLRDVPQLAPPASVPSSGAWGLVFGPLLRGAADALERTVGGAASIARRLERAGLDRTVAEFRVEQVAWGLMSFAAAASLAVLISLRSPDRVAPLAILCLLSFVLGVLLRENRLTAQVRRRERDVLAELPAVAELMALAVAAGEGPGTALERVVTRSNGALSDDLRRVLARVRTGTPVSTAFDEYSARTGLPIVARFASGIAVAIERGTPLADLLHAQAGDVREAQRRELIESGARREVLMMVPVVFLVLPITVLFAFWPGVIGLHLVTP
jgi:tight adherence protein C